MIKILNIDGFEWNIACDITRIAEMTASEISGLLLDKRFFNDVLGTYMKYDVKIQIPVWMEHRYADLYEILTKPVDGHLFILPYNQGEIAVTGRVQVVSDKHIYRPGKTHRWRDTKFTIIANHPSKVMDAEEVITTGMTPLPEAPSPMVGDLYEYTSYGWIQRYYADADEIEY